MSTIRTTGGRPLLLPHPRVESSSKKIIIGEATARTIGVIGQNLPNRKAIKEVLMIGKIEGAREGQIKVNSKRQRKEKRRVKIFTVVEANSIVGDEMETGRIIKEGGTMTEVEVEMDRVGGVNFIIRMMEVMRGEMTLREMPIKRAHGKIGIQIIEGRTRREIGNKVSK